MIEDARKISAHEDLSCDICIVGAGAAGITLALELVHTQYKVILLEAGGMNKSGKSQRLYKGYLADPTRHLPLDTDRYRQLGGTTSIWGGRCLPFDAIDFEKRSYVPYSGWPITLEELHKYYKRAHHYCECGNYSYRSDAALPDAQKQMIPNFANGDLDTSTIERWSPPTHFGKTYREELRKAPNIRVLVNAICVNMDAIKESGHISGVKVTTFRKNEFTIKPRITVLSGGGLEVTRLLLASNQVYQAGIGNHSDWLGRGYMCHVSGVIARVKFHDATNVVYAYEVDKDNIYCRRRFWISERAQKRAEILNTHILLDRPLLGDPSHGSSLMSLAFLAKNLAQSGLQRLPAKGKYGLYWKHAQNILSGSPEILTVLPRWFRNRFVQGRRIPSLLLGPKNNTFHLYYHSEQIPNRDSRITLSGTKDPLGTPRIFLDYRISETDVESIYRTHNLVDQELRSSECGHLIYESDDPREDIRNNAAVLGHHIGTTRMAKNALEGVVDENCRIHNLSNVYIASSSVFPTSSQANPTLTIVAMAIRLADHLKTELPNRA